MKMNIILKIIELKKTLLLLLVFSVFSACGGDGGPGGGGGGPIPADAGFTVYTIDNTSNTGWYSSIAAGSKVHVAYYDDDAGDLKYITGTAGSWSSPITIAAIGDWTWDTTIASIALDDSENIHVAYYDYSNNRLKYVTCSAAADCTNAGNWSTPVTVDSATNGGTDVSLTVDSSNNLHISYYDISNESLMYATCSSGCTSQINWTSITVDTTGDTGQYSSIAVDSGTIHISYYSTTLRALKYATCSSNCSVDTNWDKDITVDSGSDVGYNSSIAAASGRVHISYYDLTNGDLKYATCSSNCYLQAQWDVDTIDNSSLSSDAGEYSSIALDSGNKVHISYYDATITNENLKYATNASGSWATYTVDSSASVGEFTSISIDPDDTIHISYYDDTNSALKYAVK